MLELTEQGPVQCPGKRSEGPRIGLNPLARVANHAPLNIRPHPEKKVWESAERAPGEGKERPHDGFDGQRGVFSSPVARHGADQESIRACMHVPTSKATICMCAQFTIPT